ncbi:MAG: hypothetical protein GVY15_13380 [Bacteroidetes bacterium]|jgi:hypothetical protein|nr:hypothetical protein [Bacteroidota bacterium]
MPHFRIASDGMLASLLRQRALLFVALAALMLGTACAGSGSSRGLSDRGIYTVRLGVASLSAINREARPIFSRYGYTVERRDVYGNDQLRLRTEWRTRSVFADEQAQGYTQAQTRLFLLTRPSTGLSGTRVSLQSETRYKREEGGNWQSAAITEEAKRRIDEIAREFRDIFQVEGLN